MPQIIKTGEGFFSIGELPCIKPDNNSMESSRNDGRSWIPCCMNASYGEFINLQDEGNALLAKTPVDCTSPLMEEEGG